MDEFDYLYLRSGLACEAMRHVQERRHRAQHGIRHKCEFEQGAKKPTKLELRDRRIFRHVPAADRRAPARAGEPDMLSRLEDQT